MTYVKLILNSANRTRGKPHCATFVLKPPSLQATKYRVKKIEIPHSFYNITDANNTIYWTDNASNDQVSTLTNGNYSIDNLLTHIGTVMTADAVADGNSTTYTLTYDDNTKKINITNNLLESFDVDWGTNAVSQKLAYDLGFYPSPSAEDFERPTPVSTTGTSHTANNVFWIGSPKNILIKSNLANRAFKPACITLAKGGGVQGILEQVLVNTLAGEITTQEFINPSWVQIRDNTTISDLTFELLDEDLNMLDLNGREWTIQIEFELSSDF